MIEYLIKSLLEVVADVVVHSRKLMITDVVAEVVYLRVLKKK